MNAIIARQWNRMFSVLRYEPIIKTVAGTDHVDAYVCPGDSAGYRHVCEDFIAAATGGKPVGMDEVGQTRDVEIYFFYKENMTPEFRRQCLAHQKGVGGILTEADDRGENDNGKERR